MTDEKNPKDVGATEEKQDAARAVKPGEGEHAATGQSVTGAALEAGGQHSAISPGERRRLEVVDSRKGLFGAQGSGDTSGFGGLVTEIALPPAAQRPYGSWFDEVVDILIELLTEQGIDPEQALEKVVVDRGELTIFVDRERLPFVARSLRDDQDLRFELCLGVSGVHYPGDQGRELHAVYQLMSVTHNRNLRLEVTCPDADPHIPTVVDTYPGNDWHERETFDMFGIIFDGHPDLARSLMPDDWEGHPQRKDYPLGGIPVEYKGAVVPPPDNRRSYR
ncbi:NADH-quinone oxidoreductase subunit C [Bogoriella caseilytica]|uniref:NADH-quinone oxidoreductase subunit C n=1 Tax=Bogoriella caseilytica TaxID=56055 RepID=A0A3N2BB55_9MICO|nr:NADH-quinone oxidoreductase subunit C [Bogoriella caseilytica]ROR72314.1 NADH dehydrogenase subunit C [Bogoriella caseilytica]